MLSFIGFRETDALTLHGSVAGDDFLDFTMCFTLAMKVLFVYNPL